MVFSANKPVIVVDRERLREQGIGEHRLRRYLPEYILNPQTLRYGRLKRLGLRMLALFFKALVKLFLSPRAKSGSLDKDEVDEVYAREARTYDRKHHLTTRGMDLVWRRSAGWLLATYARRTTEPLKVLDLCTGTGLAVKEIHGITKEWGSMPR